MRDLSHKERIQSLEQSLTNNYKAAKAMEEVLQILYQVLAGAPPIRVPYDVQGEKVIIGMSSVMRRKIVEMIAEALGIDRRTITINSEVLDDDEATDIDGEAGDGGRGGSEPEAPPVGGGGSEGGGGELRDEVGGGGSVSEPEAVPESPERVDGLVE